MTRLSRLTHDELSEEQRTVWDGITESRAAGGHALFEDGSLIGPFNAFVHVPEIGRRLSSLGALLRFRTSIERRLSEVAICTVGAHWRSEFEFWAHAPMAIEHGVDPAVLDALRDGSAPQFALDDERIVHAVTHQLLVDRRVDDATYATAVGRFGEAGMVELAALVGYYCTISMILNLFEVPLPAGADRVWPVSDTT
jgi:4-carboxymuconolactone decarboxylase